MRIRSTRVALAMGGALAVALMVSGSPAAGGPSVTSASLGTTAQGGARQPWIAYQAYRDGGEGVWLIHPDGSGDHRVAAGVRDAQNLPDWSPDGRQLVFTPRGGETEPLFTFELRTGRVRQLFDCTGKCMGDDEPAWSPNGRHVAFLRYQLPWDEELNAPGDCSLWIGDVRTGALRRVTTHLASCNDREYMPRWSPDGKRLVYWLWREDASGTTGTAVGVVDADGRKARRLTDWNLFAGEPDWSPDGKWIVFDRFPLRAFLFTDDPRVPERTDLYRMRPDGSGIQRITSLRGQLRATQPRYTPDGRSIIFTAVRPTSRTLAIVGANGGPFRQITESGFAGHGTLQPTEAAGGERPRLDADHSVRSVRDQRGDSRRTPWSPAPARSPGRRCWQRC